MLESVAVFLVTLWLLALFYAFTLGGLIHLLLVAAAVVMLFRFIHGSKPVI
jgi:hypothetical protein